MASLSRPDTPEEYPWQGDRTQAAVLDDAGQREVDSSIGLEGIEAMLTAQGAAPLSERTLVVAVGSNQSPAVIAAKYRRAGHDGPVATPFLRCTVQDLAVGHSAHVSTRGYIAAAPRYAPGVATELVATWFDEAQLEIVDRSEPNYERLELSAEQHRLELSTGDRPARFAVYASRWGVVAEKAPIAFHLRQQELFDLLGTLTGADAFTGTAAEVCARLAEDPGAAGELLREGALVVPDGLPRPDAARVSPWKG